MSAARHFRLVCAGCQREVEHPFVGRCPVCRGIVECVYELAALAEALPGPTAGAGLNRWVGALPVRGPLPTLGEGDTPLLDAPRLAAELGLRRLSLKNEGRNATGSFKDRGAVVALALAREQGARGTLTASSGNAASAVAAYSAAAGLECLVLVAPRAVPQKLQQVLAYGARVLVVEDLFVNQERLLELLETVSRELERLLVFFWALSNPYTIEGMKTIAYELYVQTGGDLPDAVVVPTGGGDLYTGIWRGFCDLRRVGLIDRVPRMLAAQATGAAPLARAVAAGAARVTQIDSANTVASGIRVAFTGDHALRALRDSGGAVISVADPEILAMQRRLAVHAGIWVEPTAAVAVAAIPHFLAQGSLRADERVVCILTGAGYKDVPAEALADVDTLLAANPLPLDPATVARHAR
jgi:threonine synthase